MQTSDILEMLARENPVHRVVITLRETLRAVGGGVEEGDQVEVRVSAPMVLDHNRPILLIRTGNILALKARFVATNVDIFV